MDSGLHRGDGIRKTADIAAGITLGTKAG